MMWSDHQINYFKANAPRATLIVGQRSLVDNGLMYGPCTLDVLAYCNELDGVRFGSVCLEANHFTDDNFCKMIDEENKVLLPTAERALVDTIAFLDNNYIEGPLIESLQDYLSHHSDLSELRKVAEFYSLPQEKLDYWINEALEESDMSMG